MNAFSSSVTATINGLIIDKDWQNKNEVTNLAYICYDNPQTWMTTWQSISKDMLYILSDLGVSLAATVSNQDVTYLNSLINAKLFGSQKCNVYERAIDYLVSILIEVSSTPYFRHTLLITHIVYLILRCCTLDAALDCCRSIFHLHCRLSQAY